MTRTSITIPIIPSPSLPESTLVAFLAKAQQSGLTPESILEEAVVTAITAFNAQHAKS